MSDREKVIHALNCCAGNYDKVKSCMLKNSKHECQYADLLGDAHEDFCYECTKALAKDALGLLKEQEPVEPQLRMTKHGFRQWLSIMTRRRR